MPWPHFTPGKDLVPILQEAVWVPGPFRTGGKFRPHRDSIPDRPARGSVAIPTELPGPLYVHITHWNVYMKRKPIDTWSLALGSGCFRCFAKFFQLTLKRLP